MGMVFTWTALLLGLGLLVLGAQALMVWRGRWRWAGLAPVVLVLGVVLCIVLEVRADPTSHNLWPFEVLSVVIAAGALLGLIELIRIGAAWFGRGRHA